MTGQARRTLKEAVDSAVRMSLPRCAACSAIIVTDAPIAETALCSYACRLAARAAAAEAAASESDYQCTLPLTA